MHTRRGLLRISMRSLQLALILALTGGFVLVSSSTASAVWNKPSTWFSRPSTTQVSPSSSTTRSTGAGTASDPYQCVENSTTTFDNVPLNTNRYLVVVNSSGTQHNNNATGWTATPFDRVVFNTSTGPKAELHKTSQDDVTIQSTYPFATCVLSSDTTPPPGTTPTVTLKINNSTSDVTVDKGATKNIDWNITNFASATSCSKNQNWSGPVTSATDSSSVGPLNEVKTYTYRITCYLPDNKPAVNDEIKITTQAITQTQLNPPNLTPSGNFTTSKQITITAPTTATDNSPVSSITVRYTNDNTEPNESSPSSPLTFTITGSTVVKAKAFKTGYTQSTPASAIYTKTTTQPTNHDPVVTIKQPTNNATVTNSEDLEFIVDITDQNTDQKISTVVLTEEVSISEVFFPDQAPPLSNYKLILPKDRLTLGNHTFKIEARDDYFGGYGSGYGEVKVEVAANPVSQNQNKTILNIKVSSSVDQNYFIQDATVYINNSSTQISGRTDLVGEFSTVVGSGIYTVTIIKPGYEDGVRQITISQSSQTNTAPQKYDVTFALIPKNTGGTGRLDVTSIIEGVDPGLPIEFRAVLTGGNGITMDKVILINQQTNIINLLVPGTYQLKLHSPSSVFATHDLPKKIIINSGKITSIDIHFKQSSKQILFLKTFLENSKLTPAKYEIRDKKTNKVIYMSAYADYKEMIPFKLSKPTTLVIISHPELEPNPSISNLSALTKEITLSRSNSVTYLKFIYTSTCISSIDDIELEFPFCYLGDDAKQIMSFSDMADKTDVLNIYNSLLTIRRKLNTSTIPKTYVFSDIEGDNASAGGDKITHGTEYFNNWKYNPPYNSDVAMHEFGHLIDEQNIQNHPEWNKYFLTTKKSSNPDIFKTIIQDCLYSIPTHVCDDSNSAGHPWDNVYEYFASNFMDNNNYRDAYLNKISNITYPVQKETMQDVVKLLEAL